MLPSLGRRTATFCPLFSVCCLYAVGNSLISVSVVLGIAAVAYTFFCMLLTSFVENIDICFSCVENNGCQSHQYQQWAKAKLGDAPKGVSSGLGRSTTAFYALFCLWARARLGDAPECVCSHWTNNFSLQVSLLIWTLCSSNNSWYAHFPDVWCQRPVPKLVGYCVFSPLFAQSQLFLICRDERPPQRCYRSWQKKMCSSLLRFIANANRLFPCRLFLNSARP